MAILDTNILVRYLTDDDVELAPRAYAFLQEVEQGERTVTLPEAVLIETVQVVSSPKSYNVDRETIAIRLETILRMPGIQIANKQTYLDAFDWYQRYSRLSYVDALCVAYAQHSSDPTVVSFDRGFRNLPGIRWHVP